MKGKYTKMQPPPLTKGAVIGGEANKCPLRLEIYLVFIDLIDLYEI